MSVTIERSFHLGNQAGRTGGYRRVVREGPEPDVPPPAPAPGRIPRVAKLMALAIRCDDLLRSGAIPDATALARLAHVSQPRMTQILNLTLLAPDIQEELLHLTPVFGGMPESHEKALRSTCSLVLWSRQRQAWSAIRRALTINGSCAVLTDPAAAR